MDGEVAIPISFIYTHETHQTQEESGGGGEAQEGRL